MIKRYTNESKYFGYPKLIESQLYVLRYVGSNIQKYSKFSKIFKIILNT